MRFTLVISLLLSVLAVLFALQNPDPVDIQFGPFDVRGSTALVLIITFAIGALVGILAMVPSRFKQRKEVKALKKQVAGQSTTSAIPPEATYTPPPDLPLGDEPAGNDPARL